MTTLAVYDIGHQKISDIELDDRIFDAKIDHSLFHEVVRKSLASQRKGSAATKNRTLVRGGGAKPWRQKGTGRARAGSRRSPLWRGGGTVFGPLPRDYHYKVPKRVRKQALKSALSQKLVENKLIIVDALALDSIKTKEFVGIMKNLRVDNALIIDQQNPNLRLSARNVPKVKVIQPDGLNTYDILRYDYLVLTALSVKRIEERLSA